MAGKQHRSKERFLGDRRQDLAILAAHGVPTVRLPSDDVGDGIVEQLTAALDWGRRLLLAVDQAGTRPL
jgi:hypothetical protein